MFNCIKTNVIRKAQEAELLAEKACRVTAGESPVRARAVPAQHHASTLVYQ